MPARLYVAATYDEDPDALFERASSFADMKDATRKIAHYEHLPEIAMEEGKTYSTDITVFNVFNTSDYKIRIDRLSPEDRVMISNEGSKDIRSWRHRVDIEPALKGAVWNEVIELDAGILTPVVSRFAKFMYLRRHKNRGALEAHAELQTVGDIAKSDPVES